MLGLLWLSISQVSGSILLLMKKHTHVCSVGAKARWKPLSCGLYVERWWEFFHGSWMAIMSTMFPTSEWRRGAIVPFFSFQTLYCKMRKASDITLFGYWGVSVSWLLGCPHLHPGLLLGYWSGLQWVLGWAVARYLLLLPGVRSG